MMNKYFGELEYNYGWLTKREILLFGNKHEITVIIQAYKAEDEIPTIQDEVCKEYAEHEQEYLECIEKLMLEFDDNADTRFTPDSLYIERNGKCALLCDDAEDLDDGIAVEIIPEKMLLIKTYTYKKRLTSPSFFLRLRLFLLAVL